MMICKKLRMLALLSVIFCGGAVLAQQKVEMIPFGNMDQWVDRQIKESGIIGGATKNVYAIGPTATITENKVYKNMGGSPWATSNVMARVAGITKTNTSVFPEKREMVFAHVWILAWRVLRCLDWLILQYWLPVLCFWVRYTNRLKVPKTRRRC